MAGQTIQISVLADTRQFSRAMRGLADNTGLSRLGAMAKTAGKAVAVGLGVAGAGAVAFGAKAVSAASDLQQSIGGLDAVFQDQAGQMHEWAKSAATSVGLSRDSYNSLATAIGTTLKNAGIPMDELGGKTNDLLGLSADLAATFGGPVTQASNAMASALRGEFEPLRAYGVSLNAAAIEARALADSGKANASALTLQDKALATQALIYEQTADAQGQFARESNTLAGQQERLRAKLENIAATAGTYLLPVLTTLVTWVSDRVGPAFEALAGWIESDAVPALQTLGTWLQANVLPLLQRLGLWITTTVVPALQQFGTWLTTSVVPALQQAATWVQANASWLIPLAAALTTGAVAYMAIQRAMLIYQGVVTAVKAAQLGLNAAIAANPIGLLIALVVALVAGVVTLWQTHEGFRDTVLAVWAAIQEAIGAAVGWVTGKVAQLGLIPVRVAAWFNQTRDRATAAMLGLVAWLGGLPGRIVGALASLGGRLFTTAVGAFTRMRQGAENKGRELVTWVRGIPGRILDSLGNLGDLLRGAGRAVIDGFLGGITGAFDSVRNRLGELTDMLPDWKGPRERDRTILRDAGRLVIDGFNRGLTDRFPRVRSTLGRLTRELADTAMPTLAPVVAPTMLAPVAAGPGGRYGAARVYEVNVQALGASPEVGRAVVRAIEEYERLNGGGR